MVREATTVATSDPLQVLMLCGSARRVSYTRSLCRPMAAALAARGAQAHLIDLHATVLPLVDPEARQDRGANSDPGLAQLFRHAEVADAFVLASPVYHNSYTGLLKNALDWLGIRDFRQRPAALMSHGGRSTQAVDHLRIVVRGVLGVAITAQVCTRDDDYAPEPGGDGLYALTDKDIAARIERSADELIAFARHLREVRAGGESGGVGRHASTGEP